MCGVDSAASTQKQVSELATKLREQHWSCGLSSLHPIPALSSQKRVQGLRCSSINKVGAPYRDAKPNDSEAAAALPLTPLTPAVYSLNHNVVNTAIEGSRTTAVSLFRPCVVERIREKNRARSKKGALSVVKTHVGTGNAVEDHYSFAGRKDLQLRRAESSAICHG